MAESSRLSKSFPNLAGRGDTVGPLPSRIFWSGRGVAWELNTLGLSAFELTWKPQFGFFSRLQSQRLGKRVIGRIQRGGCMKEGDSRLLELCRLGHAELGLGWCSWRARVGWSVQAQVAWALQWFWSPAPSLRPRGAELSAFWSLSGLSPYRGLEGGTESASPLRKGPPSSPKQTIRNESPPIFPWFWDQTGLGGLHGPAVERSAELWPLVSPETEAPSMNGLGPRVQSEGETHSRIHTPNGVVETFQGRGRSSGVGNFQAFWEPSAPEARTETAPLRRLWDGANCRTEDSGSHLRRASRSWLQMAFEPKPGELPSHPPCPLCESNPADGNRTLRRVPDRFHDLPSLGDSGASPSEESPREDSNSPGQFVNGLMQLGNGLQFESQSPSVLSASPGPEVSEEPIGETTPFQLQWSEEGGRPEPSDRTEGGGGLYGEAVEGLIKLSRSASAQARVPDGPAWPPDLDESDEFVARVIPLKRAQVGKPVGVPTIPVSSTLLVEPPSP